MAYIGLVRCGNVIPDNNIAEIPAHTLVLNSEETGQGGVSSGVAEIVIRRGPLLPDAILRFNEANDKFEIGFGHNGEFREVENSVWKLINTDTLVEKNTNYFVDVSTIASINLVLPQHPSTGDTIKFVDIASAFCEKNVYVRRNDKKIMATEDDIKLVGSMSFTLVYSNDVFGWRFI